MPLFRALGDTPFANSWDGWYSSNSTFTVADGGTGKRAAYNTLPLTGLRLQYGSGQFAEYNLTANFTGRTLLSIVTGCIGSDGTSDDDESAAWAGGRCEDVGTLVSSSIAAGTAANLRIGVGDGSGRGAVFSMYQVSMSGGPFCVEGLHFNSPRGESLPDFF